MNLKFPFHLLKTHGDAADPAAALPRDAATRKVMLDVVAALIPAVIASAILFGLRALLLIAISTVACVAAEYAVCRAMKRPMCIGDLSAVVTGILLALCVPVGSNPLILVLGDIAAIVVVKQLFGGFGKNMLNPALTARILLSIAFPVQMNTWAAPFYYLHKTEAIATATPLNVLKNGADGTLPTLLNLFVGVRAGSLGETCAVALLLGGVYLTIRKVISPVIPIGFLAFGALISLIAGRSAAFDLLTGGLLLGAIFMATDPITSPHGFSAKIIYAAGAGILTMLIRIFSPLPDGTAIAIVAMNLLAPWIDRFTASAFFKKMRIRR